VIPLTDPSSVKDFGIVAADPVINENPSTCIWESSVIRNVCPYASRSRGTPADAVLPSVSGFSRTALKIAVDEQLVGVISKNPIPQAVPLGFV
jgi:hypothetical protein